VRRVYGPIGLDLGALTPEEMALAIMAEIVAVRYNRDGSPLSVKEGGSRAPDGQPA
jgi:xanthine dehydrogenase accessory factor